MINEMTGVPFYLARVGVNPEGMEELGDLALGARYAGGSFH